MNFQIFEVKKVSARVLFAETTLPITVDQLKDIWSGLRQVFCLPSFEIILAGDVEIRQWLKQMREKRPTAKFRPPEFHHDVNINTGEQQFQVTTGVSERLISFTELTTTDRPVFKIDFRKPSVVCAAWVLDWMPAGISLNIGLDRGRYGGIADWTTGQPVEDGFIVDRYAKSEKQMADELAREQVAAA